MFKLIITAIIFIFIFLVLYFIFKSTKKDNLDSNIKYFFKSNNPINTFTAKNNNLNLSQNKYLVLENITPKNLKDFLNTMDCISQRNDTSSTLFQHYEDIFNKYLFYPYLDNFLTMLDKQDKLANDFLNILGNDGNDKVYFLAHYIALNIDKYYPDNYNSLVNCIFQNPIYKSVINQNPPNYLPYDNDLKDANLNIDKFYEGNGQSQFKKFKFDDYTYNNNYKFNNNYFPNENNYSFDYYSSFFNFNIYNYPPNCHELILKYKENHDLMTSRLTNKINEINQKIINNKNNLDNIFRKMFYFLKYTSEDIFIPFYENFGNIPLEFKTLENDQLDGILNVIPFNKTFVEIQSAYCYIYILMTNTYFKDAYNNMLNTILNDQNIINGSNRIYFHLEEFEKLLQEQLKYKSIISSAVIKNMELDPAIENFALKNKNPHHKIIPYLKFNWLYRKRLGYTAITASYMQNVLNTELYFYTYPVEKFTNIISKNQLINNKNYNSLKDFIPLHYEIYKFIKKILMDYDVFLKQYIFIVSHAVKMANGFSTDLTLFEQIRGNIFHRPQITIDELNFLANIYNNYNYNIQHHMYAFFNQNYFWQLQTAILWCYFLKDNVSHYIQSFLDELKI